MPVKATKRRNGDYMLTLRPEVNVTLELASTAIAMQCAEDVHAIATASKAQILDWLRNGIIDYGMEALYCDISMEYMDEAEAAKQRLVELDIFPESA